MNLWYGERISFSHQQKLKHSCGKVRQRQVFTPAGRLLKVVTFDPAESAELSRNDRQLLFGQQPPAPLPDFTLHPELMSRDEDDNGSKKRQVCV